MSIGRRIWNAIGFGSLSFLNDSGPVQTAQVKVGYATILDGVPVVQLFGLSASAPAGADAVVLSVNGDPSNSVLIATNHQAHRPTGQASGETTLYNATGMTIYLSANGIVINGGGKNIAIENAPVVSVGTTDAPTDLQVTGNIWHRYGSGQQVGVGTHTHNQPNDSHGDTEQPTDPPNPGT